MQDLRVEMHARVYVELWVYIDVLNNVCCLSMAGEASLSAAEVAPEKRLSSLSGTFGRRRCRRTYLSFVSVQDFRPPKVPPKVPCSAISCIFSCDVFRTFRGVFGEYIRVMFLCVWSLIGVHLCRFGPEEPRTPAVSQLLQFFVRVSLR